MLHSVTTDLYPTLQGRHRPEDIAAKIVPTVGTFDVGLWKALERVAGAARYPSYMPSEFDEPKLPKVATSLSRLAGMFLLPRVEEQIDLVLRSVREMLRVPIVGPLLPSHRLTGQLRQCHVPKLSRRQYNRLFRLLLDAEFEMADYRRQKLIFRLGRIGKTGFAADVPLDAFNQTVGTAAFVAYHTARLGLRSEFTNTSQTRAFDDIADKLLEHAKKDSHTSWYAIAHVFPRHDVLELLSQQEKLALLDCALEAMSDAATILRELADKSDGMNRTVVRKGDDSSTWNLVAGGWNRARDYWLALTESLGIDNSDLFMPGKVLRLMAADVVWWHADTGGDLHGDTAVWAELPKPWDVMLGVACSRSLVEEVCRKHGVDTEAAGWTRARARTSVETFKPTPELVHGVTVLHPGLAAWFRKIGVFSGYKGKSVPWLTSVYDVELSAP